MNNTDSMEAAAVDLVDEIDDHNERVEINEQLREALDRLRAQSR